MNRPVPQEQPPVPGRHAIIGREDFATIAISPFRAAYVECIELLAEHDIEWNRLVGNLCRRGPNSTERTVDHNGPAINAVWYLTDAANTPDPETLQQTPVIQAEAKLTIPGGDEGTALIEALNRANQPPSKMRGALRLIGMRQPSVHERSAHLATLMQPHITAVRLTANGRESYIAKGEPYQAAQKRLAHLASAAYADFDELYAYLKELSFDGRVTLAGLQAYIDDLLNPHRATIQGLQAMATLLEPHTLVRTSQSAGARQPCLGT